MGGIAAFGIAAFGMVNSFDDREGSDTCAERVSRCPGCGLWLYYGPGVEPGEVVQHRQRVEIQDA